MQSIFLTVLVSAGVVLISPVEAETRGKEAITIAEYGEYLLYAPLYVAESAGLFEKYGLDATIFSAGGDEKVFAALLSGEADVGIGDPVFTAISADRGRPGMVVGGLLHSVPAWGITFDAVTPEITDPSRLNGKTVATYPAPSTSFALQKRMFLAAGLEPSIREVAFGGLVAALRSGRVDIALENEPYVSMAELQGARRLYPVVDNSEEFAFTGISVLPAFFEENSARIGKFLCAMQEAARLVTERNPIVLKILRKRFPEIPEKAIVSALDRSLRGGILRGEITLSEQAWNNAVKLRNEIGDLRGPAPYSSFVKIPPLKCF